MIRIMAEKWNKNRKNLKQTLLKTNLHDITYLELVKLTFDKIFNDENHKLDIENITEIDNGSYQGTLLYLIPFATYHPTEYEYLMTCVDYGSCSGCDTLLAIQSGIPYSGHPTEENINDFMTLCKDIIANTIKPYNYGWRKDEHFEPMDIKE